MATEGGSAGTTDRQESESTVVGAMASTDLVAEVRDRYNDPVAGVSVAFEVTDGGGVFENGDPTVTVPTDEDGRATADYRTPAGNTTTEVTARVAGPSAPADAETWRVTGDATLGPGETGGGGGEGPEDAVSSLNPGRNGQVPYVEGTAVVSGGQGTLDVCFVNEGPVRQFSSARISFFAEGNREKTEATVTQVVDPSGTTTPSPPPVLRVGQGYTATDAAVGDIGAGSETSPVRKTVRLDFDAGFSNNEFFVLSVEYDGGDRTVSYLLSAETSGVAADGGVGGCPIP